MDQIFILFTLATDNVIYPIESVSVNKKVLMARGSYIPAKVKAVIKFGYDQGMKAALGSQDFESWIEAVFTHTKAHFRHPSLGTIVDFEVRKS